jgi:hypothetical protein
VTQQTCCKKKSISQAEEERYAQADPAGRVSAVGKTVAPEPDWEMEMEMEMEIWISKRFVPDDGTKACLG